VRYLWDGRSQPVGVPVGPRSQAQEAVPADALLVWYSDGLVERRGEDLDVGLQRLADTARRLVEQAGGLDHVEVQRWTETLLAELVADRLVDDDIVVACLRLHACLEQEEPGPVLRHTLGGTHELAELRAVLRTWADRQQLEASQTEALLLVCTEAATNAATHAQSAGATSAVEVTVRRAEHGQVQLEVSDRGSWQGADTDAEHGRGLALVARLAVRTTLDLREDGTRLTIILP
jgi:anti-sigma regulatory factor (Ser/Thr protein kinase)